MNENHIFSIPASGGQNKDRLNLKAGTVTHLKDIKMKNSSYSLHPYTSARTLILFYFKYSSSFQYRIKVSLLAMCTHRAYTPEGNPRAQTS